MHPVLIRGSKQCLVDLINNDNRLDLQVDDVVFGTPVAQVPPATRNTSVTVSPAPSVKYPWEGKTITYNRIRLDSVLAIFPPGVNLLPEETEFEHALTAIERTHGVRLTADDVEAFEVPDSLPAEITLVAKPTSLLFTGQAKIQLTGGDDMFYYLWSDNVAFSRNLNFSVMSSYPIDTWMFEISHDPGSFKLLSTDPAGSDSLIVLDNELEGLTVEEAALYAGSGIHEAAIVIDAGSIPGPDHAFMGQFFLTDRVKVADFAFDPESSDITSMRFFGTELVPDVTFDSNGYLMFVAKCRHTAVPGKKVFLMACRFAYL